MKNIEKSAEEEY